MLKFGEKEVTIKDFYGQRQITDISTIDVNRVVFPDKTNNWYIYNWCKQGGGLW